MVLKRQVLGFIVSLSMLVALSLRASADSVGSGCQEAVGAFLALPSEHAPAALSGLDQAACWSMIGSSDANLNRLNHWVEQGNRGAAQYLAKHLKQLDGGNLEDALIALGQFSDHDMERLLFFANKRLLSKHELADALTMLPLSLSDNPRAQLDSLTLRRSKAVRITRPDLLEQRAQALGAIDNFTSEIRSKNPGNDR
jgi:hypothetical protein